MYGIGTYIKELIESIGNDVIYLTVIHLHDEPVIKMEETDGIRYWHIPDTIETVPYLNYEAHYKQYYRNIIYLIQLYMPVAERLVFHINYAQDKSLAEILKKTFDCKLVFTIHCLSWSFSLSGNITQFRQILTTQGTSLDDSFKKSITEAYQKEKNFFEKMDRIICLSDNTQKIIQDDYQIKPDKLTVLYNGLTDNKPIAKKTILRQKYHIPDIPVILFAGRLDNIKGLAYVLRAFKIVLNTQPHCHMIIAGNGTFDTYMKECEDIWMHVTWTGLIDKNKLYDLYFVADIGIMPSLHEQCSYVAIEMMMHGVPLIASTSTGLCEMVEDGVTGLHIPVVEHPDKVEIDSDLLAEKMLYLLQNPEETKKMGKNARKRYEEKYSSKIFRKNMLEFYRSLF